MCWHRDFTGLLCLDISFWIQTLALYDHKPSSRCGVAGSGFRPLTKILDCCHTWCSDRISVPTGRIDLPNPLSIPDLVGHYPTNHHNAHTAYPFARWPFTRPSLSDPVLGRPLIPDERASHHVCTPSFAMQSNSNQEEFQSIAFNLHVSDAPPGITQSQNQTLSKNDVHQNDPEGLGRIPWDSPWFHSVPRSPDPGNR